MHNMKEKKLAAVLTIKKKPSYKRIDNAHEVSKRLLNSAKLLPEGSSACMYADFGRNVTTGAFAVPEDNEMISTDDLRWIFDQCADVHEAPITNQSIFEECGYVYALRQTEWAEIDREAQDYLSEQGYGGRVDSGEARHRKNRGRRDRGQHARL